METTVAENYFAYNGSKYHRAKSENVVIGAVGEKKTPLGRTSYLAVEFPIAREHLEDRVRYITRAKLNWSRLTKGAWESEGQVSYFTLKGEGKARASFEKAKQAKLELLKFAIDEGALKRMLNNDAGGARSYLAREGTDGRVVSEVWVVVEGKLAEAFDTAASSGGSVSASLTKALSLQLSANHEGSQSGSATIELDPGSTFAFLMHKVKDWDRGKDRILDMEDDRKGLT